MDNKFFVLAGDGELNEGTMWEAMILAASKNLDNLCLIIDDNDSIKKMINLNDLKEKISSFGFTVSQCDGHDVDILNNEIHKLINLAQSKKCPCCLIAKTQRGYGSKTLMTDKSWFHRSPLDEELDTLLREVDLF